MKTCGLCACSIFVPMNICLAPMKIGDKRRDYSIDPETECFVPEHYAESTENRRKRKYIDDLCAIEAKLGIRKATNEK